jgi:phenylacetate-CoA ligase
MNREQLKQVQAKKFRETFVHAYLTVPFYRRLYDAVGVSVQAVYGPANLHQLPVVTRSQLQTASILERTSVSVDAASCMPLTTSGSTGTPVTTLMDPYAAAYRNALILRFMWAYGIGASDKVCRVRGGFGFGRAESSAGKTLQRGLWGIFRTMRYRLLFYNGRIDEHLEFFYKWKPSVLVAAGSYCRSLIQACEETARPLSFRRVITSAEMLDGPTRKLIGEKFGAEVFDTFGLTEVGSIAWECPTHQGYHLEADSSVVEFLRDGETVSPGEIGEVHVTPFYQRATPLLRYSTGDMAVPLDDDCKCGRGLPMMKDVQGRVMDFILTSDGRQISPIAVVGALEGAHGVEQFKVIQSKDRSIVLLFKTKEPLVEPVVEDLQSRCRRLLGDNPLEIKHVDHLDNEGAKFRVVESKLGTQDSS